MRKDILMLLFIFTCSVFDAAHAQQANKDVAFRNVDARNVFVAEHDIYTVTPKEVYVYNKTHGEWRPVFSVPAGENEINCVWAGRDVILIGTKRGLLRSKDGGISWNNVFRSIIPQKSNILSIGVQKSAGGHIFIGTLTGVFYSEDSGEHWKDISGKVKNKAVRYIDLLGDTVYLCVDDGLYLSRDVLYGWDRIIVAGASVPYDDEELQENADPKADEANDKINCVAAADSVLFVSKSRTIMASKDGGRSWGSVSTNGIAGKINCILFGEKSQLLYCATNKGVFYANMTEGASASIWLELSRRIGRSTNVYAIRFDGDDERSVWASTNRGLYRLALDDYAPANASEIVKSNSRIKEIFNSEPSLKELQGAAIKFAELDPEKIRKWRSQARLRALMPKVSIGFDKNRATNSEIYTSATREYVTVGPDDVSNGFDLSVSWELAGLVWSDDQTNIDVRSRLTTQLRNDILDDLRKAYFERRRLQFDLIEFSPPDARARFEKDMRLAELTQAIDDLTGNYLSDNIVKPIEM